MRVCSLGLLLCLAPVALKESPAQQVRPADVPMQAPKAQPPSDQRVPLISTPLHLSDFLGMQPRADLKAQLTQISSFIQNQPSDGQPATEATEVWLGRTSTTLYFVFVCHDHRASAIRSHLARRENVLNDDNVSVLLDPLQDRRKGILFTVNPAGVQADAAWTDNGNTDYSYDQVWDSEGRVTPDGWIALVAIPFRSLRSRAASSDWGVVFMRNLPRNSEQDYWPRVAASISGVLTQEGTLHGLESARGSHNVQINPYVLGQNERTLFSLDPANPYFSSRHLEGTAGGEVKAIVKDTIVLDGTINPDFSTVESDQPQFTVNQRYPVYFPELRPFFLENANYFSTPINLLYTRNIIHPEFGGRATGKIGHTNLGFLVIDDRQPGHTVAPGDAIYQKRASFAVGRVSQDLGEGSSVGLIYTDEEFGGGWNRIGGIDATARLDPHWTLNGQMVESSTRGTIDSGTPPTYAAGPASYFEAIRNGHAWSFDSFYQDYSNSFQSQPGFIQTSNIRSDQTHSEYQWYPKHSLIQSFGLETSQSIAFDHQGNRVYHYSSFDPFWLLPRKLVFAPVFGQNSDTLGPQNGYLLTQNRNFTENNAGIVFRGAPLPQLNFNFRVFGGGNVNYNPRSGTPPSLMNQITVQALFTLQPMRQLTMDNTYLLDRDRSVANGALVYESQTFRTKVNYQFTRSLSARVIVEYDTTLANPAETSLLRTKQIGTQVLMTWLPHPGTAIYLGYNNDLANLDRTLCARMPGGACDTSSPAPRSPAYLDDGRQIFLKASYLFRF
ncbi:MAG TPA: carbohydrate binding family 9 domain-containing protein [Acidobacteriaceae bacterium]